MDEERDIFNRGKKPVSISVENMILLTVLYLRDYDTFFNLGFSFGICESYSHKIYHKISSLMLKFLHVGGSRKLAVEDLGALVIDVSEQPIERPKKNQKEYFSGKKKRHTIKSQLIISLDDLMIRSVFCGKGKIHDFNLFKKSKTKINKLMKLLADSGYQGILTFHYNSETPIKKKKGKELTEDEKQYNRELSKKRIVIENVNRRCKIFRIVKEVFRGKHKNYGKTWNLIAGLVNLRYQNLVL